MTLRLPRSARCSLPALFALGIAAHTALAQPGGWHGGGSHGRDGGHWSARSDGSGGGPSGFIDGILSRMDANGNGMIDPNEADGRAQYFLRRLMPNADFSRPIPIDQIKRAAEEARSRFSGGGPPRGGDRPHGGDRSSDRRPTSRSRDDSSEPLVPGFGNEFNTVPVLGFGEDAKRLPRVEVTEMDQRRAYYMMRYMDRNHDRFISREEAKRHSSLYQVFKSDANRDDKIDARELAQHYARQRLARPGGGMAYNGSRYPGQRPPSGGPGGGDHRDSGYDSGRTSSESRARTDSGDRRVYRIRTAEERLPPGLPDWFTDRDADGDGQVMMSEYASDWTDELVAEFNRFDANRDGVIAPHECLEPATTPDAESAATSQESASPEPGGTSEQPSASVAIPAASEVSPAYLQYAEGVIKKYDKDGNGVLNSDEWSEMSKSPEAADTDRNGQVTAAEYAAWIANQ